MAFRIRRKRREIEEIPLASTADIAFLLIVFYLAASSLIEMKGVQIPLPRPDAPPMQILKKNIYRLSIAPDGSFVHDRASLSHDELLADLLRERSANPELVILLKVDPNAPTQSVPEAIRLLQQAKIEKFSMSMEGIK